MLLEPGTPPMPLYLNGVKSGDNTLLVEPVQVCTTGTGYFVSVHVFLLPVHSLLVSHCDKRVAITTATLLGYKTKLDARRHPDAAINTIVVRHVGQGCATILICLYLGTCTVCTARCGWVSHQSGGKDGKAFLLHRPQLNVIVCTTYAGVVFIVGNVIKPLLLFCLCLDMVSYPL